MIEGLENWGIGFFSRGDAETRRSGGVFLAHAEAQRLFGSCDFARGIAVEIWDWELFFDELDGIILHN